jgi:hypothetical protein
MVLSQQQQQQQQQMALMNRDLVPTIRFDAEPANLTAASYGYQTQTHRAIGQTPTNIPYPYPTGKGRGGEGVASSVATPMGTFIQTPLVTSSVNFPGAKIKQLLERINAAIQEKSRVWGTNYTLKKQFEVRNRNKYNEAILPLVYKRS